MLLGHKMSSYIIFLGGCESAVQRLLSIKAHSMTNASFHTQPHQARVTVACGYKSQEPFKSNTERSASLLHVYHTITALLLFSSSCAVL